MDKMAFIFSGQGAQDAGMMDLLHHYSTRTSCQKRLATICDGLGENPIKIFNSSSGPGYLTQNKVSSVLIVFLSILIMEEYTRIKRKQPQILIGYSVGQWTALYAAGMLGFEELIELLCTRAELMNECISELDSGMVSVIGVEETQVQNIINRILDSGLYITISNYNSFGQYSVAGVRKAIDRFVESVQEHNPKKISMLPVQGAWHCALLDKAAEKFLHYLQGVSLHTPHIPVVDNLTGEYIPEDRAVLKQHLARHINNPVQWHKSVNFAIANGCSQLIECGYGNMLTKMGLYINRKVEHVTAMELLEL